MNEHLEFMEALGLKPDKDAEHELYPWMQAHRFVVIKSLSTLREVIDKAIASGMVALDLETEGFDNRVYYDNDGLATSYKKIVGYCLCYDGVTGYYVPVGHKDESVNLDYLQAGKEISRLCHAAQVEPKKSEWLLDTEVMPPPVKILFWNAKFDQEWLYHVTQIRYWHPKSFEDGNLLAFCVNTDWHTGLKDRSEEMLTVKVPDYKPHELQQYHDGGVTTVGPKKAFKDEKRSKVVVPYRMVKITSLFQKGRKVAFHTLHPDEAVIYAASDAITTYRHFQTGVLMTAWDKLRSTNPAHMDTYTEEKIVTQALREMERNRFKIDIRRVDALLLEAEKEKEELNASIQAKAKEIGISHLDINSPQQVGNFLFSEDGLNLEPKPEQGPNGWKTGTEVLTKLAEDNPNPVLREILKYRQVDKVIGTYLKNLKQAVETCPERSLRSNFNQTGTATGRFTAPSGDPEDGCGVPTHGIPSSSDDRKPKVATALRYCFICEPDEYVVKIDYAGQELRAVTNITHEPVWVKEFLHGKGDLHTITAQAFFGKEEVTPTERKAGKISNFGLIYGGGPNVIERATGCSREEALRRKKAFDAKVPVFAEWVKGQHKKVKKDLGIRNAFGRWIAIPDAGSTDNSIQAACERKATNFPIQSAGADIMKLSMIYLQKMFEIRGWRELIKMRLTVHDEIVFTVKRDKVNLILPEVKRVMESVATKHARNGIERWQIPMEVEVLIDTSWAAKNDWFAIYHGEPYKESHPLKPHEYVFDVTGLNLPNLKISQRGTIKTGLWVYSTSPLGILPDHGKRVHTVNEIHEETAVEVGNLLKEDPDLYVVYQGKPCLTT